MIKINESNYPTKVGEMSLKQWINISDAVRVFEKEPILQFEGVLKAMNVPDKQIDTIPLSFAKELYASLEDTPDGLELKTEIDKYKLDLSKPLNVKTSKMIDKLHECGNQSIALLAFFYRDETLTDNEHFDNAHVKHKMKYISEMPASDFVVAIGVIMEYLTTEAKEMSDESK